MPGHADFAPALPQAAIDYGSIPQSHRSGALDNRAMARWIAVIGWAVTPAILLFSRYVSLPLKGEDVATLGIPVVIALAIAAGSRIGRVGAGLGAGLAGIVALLSAYIVFSGCLGRCGDFAWLGPIGAGALSVISFAATRRIR
jgi:hypothetical protein